MMRLGVIFGVILMLLCAIPAAHLSPLDIAGEIFGLIVTRACWRELKRLRGLGVST